MTKTLEIFLQNQEIFYENLRKLFCFPIQEKFSENAVDAGENPKNTTGDRPF